MKPENIIIPKYYPFNKILGELKEFALDKNIILIKIELYIRTIINLSLLFIPLTLFFIALPI